MCGRDRQSLSPVCWGQVTLCTLGSLACLWSWAMRKYCWSGRREWVTGSRAQVEETKDLNDCSSCRAWRMTDSTCSTPIHCLNGLLRDVLHCKSNIPAQFRSTASLLAPPRAATNPAGIFTWSWFWFPEKGWFFLICHWFCHLLMLQALVPLPLALCFCGMCQGWCPDDSGADEPTIHVSVNAQPAWTPGHLGVCSRGAWGVSVTALAAAASLAAVSKRADCCHWVALQGFKPRLRRNQARSIIKNKSPGKCYLLGRYIYSGWSVQRRIARYQLLSGILRIFALNFCILILRPVYSALTSLLTRPTYCRWLYGPCGFWHEIWVITVDLMSEGCELPIKTEETLWFWERMCCMEMCSVCASTWKQQFLHLYCKKSSQKVPVIKLGEPKHLEGTEHPCGRNCIHPQPCSTL